MSYPYRAATENEILVAPSIDFQFKTELPLAKGVIVYDGCSASGMSMYSGYSVQLHHSSYIEDKCGSS